MCGPVAEGKVSCAEWGATLQTVRHQLKAIAAASSLQVPGVDGDWYDIDGAQPESVSSTRSNDLVWRQQQWHEAFEALFLKLPKLLEKAAQQDDLLFFVPLGAAQGLKGQQVFVRRRTSAIPEDLQPGSPGSAQVDWFQSVLLNLVMQTSFELCTAACRQEEIPHVAGLIEPAEPSNTAALSSDRQAVAKRVYASTTFTPMQQYGGADRQPRDAQPVTTYPDLSFAVEDYADAFESLVLKEAGWVYFVMLTATGGLALASPPALPSASTAQPAPQHDDPARRSVPLDIAQPPLTMPEAQALQSRLADEDRLQHGFASISHEQPASAQPLDYPHPLASGSWQSPSDPDSHYLLHDRQQPASPLQHSWANEAQDGPGSATSAQLPLQSRSISGEGQTSLASAFAHASTVDADADDTDAADHGELQERASSSLLSARPIFAGQGAQSTWPALQQQQQQPAPQQQHSMHDGHPLAELFRHPLQSPRTSADPAPPSGQPSAASHVAPSMPGAAAGQSRVVLYSGQVEFEALQAACRSGLWGVPSEPETKLKMRLPRGKGGGDLLVTRIARPKNNGHVMLQPGQAQRPAGRGTFMARKWASAKEALHNVAQSLDPPVHIRCALLHLELPVDLLAAKILQLPTKDI